MRDRAILSVVVRNKTPGRETIAPSWLRRCVVCCLAGLAAAGIPRAGAAPFMIIGNDEKPGTDAQGKPIVNPTGNDTVQMLDLAKPEAPKTVATLKLENSIVGPPVNLDISSDGRIA